jgi:Mg2+/Co2+ transporter CorB
MEDGSFLIPFMSVMGLILMSAFFSGSETGMTSVSREKIHKLKMEGNKRAVILSQLREDKERLIGAILLGNNVVNIGASAIATALAIRYVGESGVIYATVVMTVLVLVFAEVLPKTYAVRHAESVALFVAPVFVLVTKVLSPLTNAVQVVVNSTLNLLSNETAESMTGVEVLRGAVDMYHEDGEMLKDDKDMLSGILNLDATLIEDVMVHRSEMASISIDEPAAKIVTFMANSSHTRVPVWKDAPDKIVGILHAKDILRAIEKLDGKKNTLDIKLLLRKPWFVPESTTLKNQLKVFRENQKHFALVVDEFGSITGLVTLEDIIEEIVGEIEDEHDKPNQPRIKKGRGGTFNVDGDVSIRDLNRDLDWSMSDINATTVAGVVLQAAQGIPNVGDIFEVDEFMLKVLKRSGTQITRIQIRKIEESDID